jgi:hypothetical protein
MELLQSLWHIITYHSASESQIYDLNVQYNHSVNIR